MTTRRTKATTTKTIPPPPGPEEGYDALIAYLHRYPAEELEKAGYLQEPSAEEIAALDRDMAHHFARKQVMGLAKEYPRTSRQRKPAFTALLKRVPGLKPAERKDLANALDIMSDKAHDLEEIIDRLLHEAHSPEEIAELLVAFQVVTNYLRSYGEGLTPKVYDLFDQVKGLTPTNHERR